MRLRSRNVRKETPAYETEYENGKFLSENDAGYCEKRLENGPSSLKLSHLHFLNISSKWKPILYVLCCILTFLYIIVPTVLYLFPSLIKLGVFLSMVRWPPYADFNDFNYFRLTAARNFKVPSAGVPLGAWHIAPKALIQDLKKDNSSKAFEKSLSSGHPIIIYFHGNAGTRARSHRVQFYKVIRAQDLHVIAFDYRGFADSPGDPSEQGMVEDGRAVFKWVKERSGNAPVFLWGHSLGSGAATGLAKQLSKEDIKPNGLILEAPISSIRDAAFGHPLGALWRYMPFFEVVFVRAMEDQHIYFNNVENIADVSLPILLMHAEDDGIVPYEIGMKLVEAARTKRAKTFAPFEFVSFDPMERCGHYMFRSKNLPAIVSKFVQKYR